jgi:hypothetical protein
MITNNRLQKERSSLYFHDRCKEIHLMLQDCLVYPKHLKDDETLLKKLKILNYALAEFENVCNNMIISTKNSSNK